MSNAFYHSSEWRKFREIFIGEQLEEHGELICARCGKPILKPYDCILHHKIELNESNINDPEVTLNPDNIETLHLTCHNKEHGKGYFWNGQREVYLVYGPPSVGKSSYVNSIADANDLIVDVEAIYAAISTGRGRKLIGQAIRIRDMLIDEISHRVGKWQNAYIVGGYPIASDRERVVAKTAATEIFMIESKEELLKRERARGRDGSFVEDWFYKYERTGGKL